MIGKLTGLLLARAALNTEAELHPGAIFSSSMKSISGRTVSNSFWVFISMLPDGVSIPDCIS